MKVQSASSAPFWCSVLAAVVAALTACAAPSGPVASAPNSTPACQQSDVSLNTSVNESRLDLGVQLTIRMAFPNNMSCVSPLVTAELEDSHGNQVLGVLGNPTRALGEGSCSTNETTNCEEETFLYWSNWCGTIGLYQVVATAFSGRLRSATPITSPPTCTNSHATSQLAGIYH